MSKCKYNNLHTRTIIYKPSTYVVYVNKYIVKMYVCTILDGINAKCMESIQEHTSGTHSHSQRYKK